MVTTMPKKREVKLSQEDLLHCLDLLERLTRVLRKAVESSPRTRKYVVELDEAEFDVDPPVAWLADRKRC